jgi:hypothetical protein
MGKSIIFLVIYQVSYCYNVYTLGCLVRNLNAVRWTVNPNSELEPIRVKSQKEIFLCSTNQRTVF